MRTRPSRVLWDPGAQPERTYQAWTRTALAAGVCALVLTRLAPRGGPAAVAGALAVAVVVAAGALAVVARQRRRLRAGSLRPAPGDIAGATAGTLLLATAAAVLVIAA